MRQDRHGFGRSLAAALGAPAGEVAKIARPVGKQPASSAAGDRPPALDHAELHMRLPILIDRRATDPASETRVADRGYDKVAISAADDIETRLDWLPCRPAIMPKIRFAFCTETPARRVPMLPGRHRALT
ncbi:hypothetical protein BJF93_13960 [Xaviernesmea oryzae]|uniref:Uncharacterized protein n=1 Tax=Xaviernesmea oryzae TaxID=464029 RepID=A0A1Q9AR86_9HYPH|nr:hypothetical protein [Xaviernesmea oryzae]OLP57937.1 hypothetical protein BJF93_13960 [Xaviernesmea oryzae]